MAKNNKEGWSLRGIYSRIGLPHATDNVIFDRDTTEQHIIPLEPITPYDLLGGKLEAKPDLKPARGKTTLDLKAMHTDIGKLFLHPFLVEKGDQKTYVACGPALVGMSIDALLYFSARSNVFGLDTRDTLNDWVKLYTHKSNEELLKRHQRIPGWKEVFEPSREVILDIIRRDNERQMIQGISSDETDVMAPLIQITRNIDGQLAWNYTLDTAVAREITAVHYGRPHLQPERIQPALGPAYVGSYAQDVVRNWPERQGFPNEEPKDGEQDMGATQSLPFTIWQADDLLASRFISNLVRYMDAGEIPPVANEFDAEEKKQARYEISPEVEIFPDFDEPPILFKK